MLITSVKRMTREEAIKIFNTVLLFGRCDCPNEEIIECLKMAINALAEDPKKGEWIEHFDESGKWYECDQCHTDWGGAVNFCPNCGADMRGVVDE